MSLLRIFRQLQRNDESPKDQDDLLKKTQISDGRWYNLIWIYETVRINSWEFNSWELNIKSVKHANKWIHQSNGMRFLFSCCSWTFNLLLWLNERVRKLRYNILTGFSLSHRSQRCGPKNMRHRWLRTLSLAYTMRPNTIKQKRKIRRAFRRELQNISMNWNKSALT